MKRSAWLRKAGYRVIEAWACEVGGRIDDVDLPKVERKSFPHAILFDFEAYGDENHRKEPMPTFTIENAHVPISVSVGDTLKREPTHICERDPAELVSKFMEELERRGKNIRAKVRAEFVPKGAAAKNRGMVRPGSCRRVQLSTLRPESDQKPLD